MAEDTEAAVAEPDEAEVAQDADAIDADDDVVDGEGGGKKRSKKKLILMIAVPVLVLLLGGGGAAFFLLGGEEPSAQTAEHGDGADPAGDGSGGNADDQAEGASDADQVVDEGASKRPEGASVFYAASGLVFYDLPDMIVNLNSTSRQSRYLKIKVALEFGDPKVVDQIETVMPRIIDHFQVYLRELREDDLRGSAGLYRLKEELMIRVNQALRPAKIRDVLFKEMLVQ